MRIIKATYGPKDVTEHIKNCFKNKKLNLFVSNLIFGDTNHGVLKLTKMNF